MSTVTNFEQLKAYWWNSSNTKKTTVSVNLRDLRPRNSTHAQLTILIRLAYKALELAEKKGRVHEMKIQRALIDKLLLEAAQVFPTENFEKAA